VRNRDYFFTPGFVYFGVLLGVGLTGLLYDLADWIKGRAERKYIMVAALVVSVILPIHTLKANYFHHDRSNNYIPWDYAYNILTSIDENGIVFTNGDNDTFPLWYIQEVEHFRQDVRVINLSLLNTSWYIHQLKEQMNVPISYSHDKIDALRPVWDPVKERVWRIQDEMIRDIITTNNWRDPIFFAVTVSSDNRMGLDDNFVMQGMGYKLVSSKGNNRVDPDRMWELYMEEFKFTGLDDSTLFKNENDTRLIANYVSGFLQLADTLKKIGEIDKAIEVAERSVQIYPQDWRHRAYLSALYLSNNQADKIGSVTEGVNPDDAVKICINAAQEALFNKDKQGAANFLRMALKHDPKSVTAFNNLVFLEEDIGNYEAIDSLTAAWRLNNVGDPEALSKLDELLRALNSHRRSKGDTLRQ
jgi:tetratricopeptide (TPR) repeat protein